MSYETFFPTKHLKKVLSEKQLSSTNVKYKIKVALNAQRNQCSGKENIQLKCLLHLLTTLGIRHFIYFSFNLKWSATMHLWHSTSIYCVFKVLSTSTMELFCEIANDFNYFLKNVKCSIETFHKIKTLLTF